MRKFLILFFLSCSFYSFAQNNTIVTDQLAEQLQSLTKNNSTDILYLQTNKGIYETEEDIWFKGYVLNAQSFTPSERSKILFVQLTEDQTNKVVWEKKYEIENGFVDGHLFLENSLPEGTYTLAGYSTYSFTKNPKEFYGLKKLKIVRTINKRATVNPIEKDSIVHFSTFPEGGRLVSGIQSTLAFKAVNSKGLPVDISGTLFEDNIPLKQFKSSHAGMGALIFTPNSNKKYHIQLTEPARAEIFPVGPIDLKGKVLSLLSNTKEDLVFKISQSDTLPKEKVYLRLQLRGAVYSIAMGVLKKDLIIKIPLKDIPQGIAEVTLFNENAKPLAERLVYVNQEQKLTIKTTLDKNDYTTREQVNVKIKVTDQDGQGVVAHLGLSVYDGLYQNKQDGKDIQSHFLLTTQLKGQIYNPGYYFNELNKDRKQALNLLMLTQGWRSYVWNEANLRELGTTPMPVVFDELKGRVELKKPGKRVTIASGRNSIMIFSADEGNKVFMMTDSTGVFNIGTDHFKIGSGGYTYIKLLTPQDSKLRMNIQDFSFEQINKQLKAKTMVYPLPAIEQSLPETMSPFMEREAINKLSEVVITSKKEGVLFRNKYIGKLDSLARAKWPTSDYVCVSNILNCPQQECHKEEATKPIEGERYDEYVNFKWSNGPCSPYTFSGMKSVIYHYPDFTQTELLEMFNIAMVEGFYGKKVFYEAVYDNVTVNDPLPDYRNTLFWKPNIITDEQGEATITFFCSDINSLFLGSIEGVSGEGLLGAENFKFSVKKAKHDIELYNNK